MPDVGGEKGAGRDSKARFSLSVMEEIRLPATCLVVLVGASSAGKSTWAEASFAWHQVVSSDRLRAMVGASESDRRAGTDAFDLLDDILGSGYGAVCSPSSTPSASTGSAAAAMWRWRLGMGCLRTPSCSPRPTRCAAGATSLSPIHRFGQVIAAFA